MILIVDSGSTKTDWCMIAGSGKTEHFQTEGMNPYQQSEEKIREIVSSKFLPQIAHLWWIGPVTNIYFYGAGCTPEKKHVISDALSQCFKHAQINVESDMVGAAIALFGNTEGIAAILGTGSNSCHWDGKQIVQNVPALGYILGDEGSGAVLGKRLVADILKNQMSSALKDKFFDRFNTTMAEIIDRVYRQPMPNRYLASLSVFAAENKDNEDIYRLLQQHFDSFIHRNLKQYPSLSVGFIGSIAYYYKDCLMDRMEKAGLRITCIDQSPMQGLIKYHKEQLKAAQA